MMGNALQTAYVWTFTTGVSPTVISTNPANLATGIPLDRVITATFSTAMDSLTVTQVPQKVARGLHNPNVVATFGLCISNVAPSRGKVGTAATVNWWNPTVTPKRASPATAQSKSWKSFPSWKGAA